jgi:2-keto-4-pentenoate hydratase/2-oxohepta-3-ene-1,7-dioic acid hydratase in catechol pathway
MRLANAGGRACLVVGGRSVDLERRSGGRFASDPMQALARWDELADWAAGLRAGDADAPLDEAALGPCVPRPQKVFGIGLNYRDHAREAALPVPKEPLVFTKFPSCLAGPRADVPLSSERVDWEVELVFAIARRGRAIPVSRAFEHVAGYCVGQDISDRRMQFAGQPPQFSLGKSADGYGPIGPALVSLDEVPDRAALRLTCDVAGRRMQDGNTRDMIFGVPELVAFLSRHITLEPGDLVFSGTPMGTGGVQKPPRYLAPGEEIASEIEGLGRLLNRCLAPRA